jgi:hypothetical protein
MNCREAQNQIFAERDGALAETERAALVSHVAECGDCRRIREDLVVAVDFWRVEAAKAVVPDAEREWHAVRRKIRGGVEGGEVRLTPRRSRFLTWVTVPLAAVGALALALFISLPTETPSAGSQQSPPSHVARAESVEVSGRNASTMVYVDDKSGWLIVLASETAPKQG